MFTVSTSAYDAANARNGACKTTAFSNQVKEEKEEEKKHQRIVFLPTFYRNNIFYAAVMSFTLLVNNDARPPDGEVRNDLFEVSLFPSCERTKVFNVSITQRQSNNLVLLG